MTVLLQASMLCGAGLLAGAVHAQQADIPDSRDPHEIGRFPRSWIVEYRQDDEVRPREFVMSRVDRIRRDMRVEDELNVDGTLETVTYRIPEGASVTEVMDHYRKELGGDVLFECRGRDCGRSNDWANQVFEQANLYGPDANQRYAAVDWRRNLVAVYVIERGNKRVYAHLRFLEPSEAAELQPNALLAQRLAEHGWAAIDAVSPGPDGGLEAPDQSVLGSLAGKLQQLADERLYVVCHVAGDGEVDVLIAASVHCAETSVELIAGGEDDAGGEGSIRFEPFGVGPLMPRPGLPGSRVELVVPALLRQNGD